DRVREVEEVRERPDPRVRNARPPTGRGLDEGAQPARRYDPAGEDDPDGERDGEDGERERHDETGRADALVTGDSRQEAEQDDRPADGREREPEQEVSREASGGASRLVGARPRDGSAPSAAGRGAPRAGCLAADLQR